MGLKGFMGGEEDDRATAHATAASGRASLQQTWEGIQRKLDAQRGVGQTDRQTDCLWALIRSTFSSSSRASSSVAVVR